MLAEIHVAPTPSGDTTSQYAHIKAAIAVVRASGLKHEVGALGTTMQGADDKVWATLRAAHEATLAAGAEANLCNIRLFSRPAR